MTTDRVDYEDTLKTEIAAIRRIRTVLDKLDVETRQRIVRYLVDRYTTKP